MSNLIPRAFFENAAKKGPGNEVEGCHDTIKKTGDEFGGTTTNGDKGLPGLSDL